MNRIRFKLSRVLAASLCWGTVISAWAQGSLTPPDAPAPTFRTLDQIEPRIPITHLPFPISQPGSYYLTQSLTATNNATALPISAPDVVIDLMGYSLTGTNTAFGISSSFPRLTVKNGTLKGWLYAVDANSVDTVLRNLLILGCGHAIEADNRTIVSDCQIVDNSNLLGSFFGIYVGDYSSVRNCVVANNFGAVGWSALPIHVGTHSFVIDCQVFNNYSYDGLAYYGISAGYNSRISGCVVRNGHREGIQLLSGGVIQDCISAYNEVGIKTEDGTLIEHCSASGNSTGIVAGTRCQVVDCEISENTSQGLFVTGDGNRIVNNVCSSNFSSGLFVFSDDNRLEGNHVFGNDFGIYLRYWGDADKADRNLLLRNSAHQNRSENYHIVAGNFVAPIDSTGAFSNASANYSF